VCVAAGQLPISPQTTEGDHHLVFIVVKQPRKASANASPVVVFIEHKA
jgi:hypothetical protein